VTGPNLLLIMVDQLAAAWLPAYGHPVVQSPAISALARDGVVFESAYCPSPLCAPSRASILTGRLPSQTGVYDNGAELPAATPTLAHHLRALGYSTCLAGKMHFVGPDQLHGFEERLTPDIYPAGFDWTPDWRSTPGEQLAWYHTMESVLRPGRCEASLQQDYDDEVAFASVRKLFDIARGRAPEPFFLVASFTHPHDPWEVRGRYWDRYAAGVIDLPSAPPPPLSEADPHSRRIREMIGSDEAALTEEQIRNARHAYYGMISYIDDRVGALLRALDDTGLKDNTIVVFTSDHGDMLGERGMWYKMCFFEWSARVPLIVSAPGRFAPRRVAHNVSHLDLFPTFLEVAAAGGAKSEPVEPIDGRSLMPLMQGRPDDWPDTVFAEYLAEGTTEPCFMVKRGRHKYVTCPGDPPQLYDLASDPWQLENLAGRSDHAEAERALAAAAAARWDPAEIRRQVILSQRRRLFVFPALRQGRVTAWDFQPHRDASRQYNRNHEELYDTDRRARIPHRAA
jgi:choline-sulfatase